MYMYMYLPLCVYTCINFMWVYCLVGLSVTNNVNLLNCWLTTSAVFCCLDCTSVFWLVLLSTYLSSAVLWVRPVFWLVTQRMRSLGSTSQLCELSHFRYGALLKIFTFFLHIITFLPPICCVNLYSTCADQTSRCYWHLLWCYHLKCLFLLLSLSMHGTLIVVVVDIAISSVGQLWTFVYSTVRNMSVHWLEMCLCVCGVLLLNRICCDIQ